MTMKIYSVSFKVNGGKTCQKTVTATSSAQAKMAIQSDYPSDKITFMSVREVR